MADGSIRIWAMSGDDRGEVVAELRSLKLFTEVVMPIALDIFTVLQLSVFAFSTDIPWNHTVAAPPRSAIPILTLDLHGLNGWVFQFRKSSIVFAEMIFLLVVMLVFLACAWFGVTSIFDNWMRHVQGSEEYTKEEKERHHAFKNSLRHNRVSEREIQVPTISMQKPTGTNSQYTPLISQSSSGAVLVAPPAKGLAHVKLNLLKRIDRAVELFMFAVSTIMVVPVVKYGVKYMICVKNEEGIWKLKEALDVTCFEGEHLFFEICLFAVGPLFIISLLPYAVVRGQVQYVQQHELYQPKLWVKNATRRGSSVDRDFLTYRSQNIFVTEVVDFTYKVLIPCVTVLTSHSIWQQILLTAISGFFFILSFTRQAFVDPRMNAFRRINKAVVFAAFGGGLLSTYRNDTESWVPFLITGSVLVLVVGFSLLWVLRQPSINYSSLLLKKKQR
eukprot:gnl/MRDRNA2_/MRDRNA2_160623_c0_seq1.p1 gnl/MRDRNA2_/MRDRNA2_160623_c0~~gnl/MRDRNA2_/MRDRNA2_160623_c0_seq1.p1  ORF type:complete len:506 (+),score=61.72 gnl/MRDRNA2_/MRDRNA2_160623_c0_seq1:184-1518(+)